MEEFTQSQKERLEKVIKSLKQQRMVLLEIEEEFYKLGSFPESPLGYTADQFGHSITYIQSWLDQGGIDL